MYPSLSDIIGRISSTGFGSMPLNVFRIAWQGERSGGRALLIPENPLWIHPHGMEQTPDGYKFCRS